MSQEDGKCGAETCEGVIEQSDGWKNRRKRQAKKRKSGFFSLSCFWSFTIEREEMTFTHRLPVGLRGPEQITNLNPRVCLCLSLFSCHIQTCTEPKIFQKTNCVEGLITPPPHVIFVSRSWRAIKTPTPQSSTTFTLPSSPATSG